jgi:hydroxymethylglutaryl-CoA synthase
MALDWIRSGSAAGKKALILCSDIARYGLNTAGEPTQGAGAVALLVSESPRLLTLEQGSSGMCSLDVHDFWRPLYSKDAFVDGHYSVDCYLDALTKAYQHHKELVGEANTPGYSDRFAALAYHVPYGKMAKKAHRALRTVDGDTAPDASFEAMVGASLMLPSQVGNIYTGSLYLALTSLLQHTTKNLDGQRLGLFSYGSGCCAEFFTGTVVPGAQEKVRALGLDAQLAGRRALSMPEYESVMNARDAMDQKPAEAPGEGTGFRYLGTTGHRRIYAK